MTEYRHDTVEKRMKDTFFVVEVTDFEAYTLWEHHSKTSRNQRYKQIPNWVQINPGWMIQVGGTKKVPYCISVSWYRIEGHLVLFWHGCSLVTHHGKAEEWIKKHFGGMWDNNTRLAMTNASNFHHCVQAIEEVNKV